MAFKKTFVQVGFAFVVAAIVALLGSIPLAIIYMVLHLVTTFILHRKTVRGTTFKRALEKKYPDIPKPDMTYLVNGREIILADEFIKSSMLALIPFDDYCANEDVRKENVENYYASVRNGEYSLTQYIITKKETVPDSDGPDSYIFHCDSRCFQVLEVGKNCRIGDNLIGVRLQNTNADALLIWLNPKNMEPVIVDKHLYSALIPQQVRSRYVT